MSEDGKAHFSVIENTSVKLYLGVPAGFIDPQVFKKHLVIWI